MHSRLGRSRPGGERASSENGRERVTVGVTVHPSRTSIDSTAHCVRALTKRTACTARVSPRQRCEHPTRSGVGTPALPRRVQDLQQTIRSRPFLVRDSVRVLTPCVAGIVPIEPDGRRRRVASSLRNVPFGARTSSLLVAAPNEKRERSCARNPSLPACICRRAGSGRSRSHY